MPLHVGKASAILIRTLPYVVLRILIYAAFGFLFLLYWFLVYLLGQAVAHLHENIRIGVWLVALFLPFPIIKFFREYILYVVKAGHLAVIAELASKGSLPDGINQISWGKEQVVNRFKETSVLFVVDRLVLGVIGTVNSIMYSMGSMFSGIPGMEGMMSFARTVLRFSLTYMDESILARNFIKPQESVWESAKNGVILYAQSWKEILKTALMLGVLSILSYAILLALYFIPAYALIKAYPALQWVWILSAFTFAWITKLALLDPFCLTNMVIVYLKETEGKIPDRTWEGKLEAASGKFRELKQKALESAGLTR
ncbi:MAG: hypothetical protein JNK65_00245 [Deltaproteobacteria bacterium]|nr:hypothetical protein [Deltaproteobacteria bacterium]